MKIVNLTPHVVRLNDGTEFPPSGQVARVSTNYTPFVDGVCSVEFGAVTGLPTATPVCAYCGTINCEMLSGAESVCSWKGGAEYPPIYVTSILVAQAAKRTDVVAPASGHPETVRKDGQVWSVPGFVRA